MKLEVYCDESQQDVFWSKSPAKANYLLIGSLWLPADKREEIKERIKFLRLQHACYHEIKWRSVTNKNKAFYSDLLNLFMAQGNDLRFRCIAVEASKVDMVRFHEADAELGFYKFYYQLIKHWIFDFNEYNIFCDEKTNRKKDRLKTLRETLDYSNITSTVVSIQALPSKEVAILQLVDLLLGAVSARMNQNLCIGGTKEYLVIDLERKLGRELGPTWKSEEKFNVFKIRLEGGW